MRSSSPASRHDVIVVGAGPAGCVAATVLARAGVRVLLLDRARFPRDKLCGDTVNPGALRLLRRLNLPVTERGLVVDGMLVSGPDGVRVTARYPGGLAGRAIVRRDLDLALLSASAKSGVAVDEGVLVQEPIVLESAGTSRSASAVGGVVVRSRGGRMLRIPSRLVIAADGRQSRIARHLGLARHPPHPRRWAVGAYFSDVFGMTSLGEMHVRPHLYIGVAAVPGNLVNACVVCGERGWLRSQTLLSDALAHDPELRERFSRARMVAGPVTLGPLAVECPVPGVPGLLLAGDAAGFIDPMTGDGLRFAVRGGELAAIEALRALEAGACDGHVRLLARRQREFGSKWRFNRALRRLTRSTRGIRAASYVSRWSSWPVARIIGYAGDLGAA